MGEGTREIRAEIEETRARVGEEVDALSYKTDVGARLDDYVTEKKDAVTSKLTGAKDSVVGTVVPSKDRLRSAKDTAKRNPLGLAIGGAAIGFVAGLLLPSTRVEDEHLGEMATRIKDTAKEAGQEAIERGKEVASTAMDSAREEGGRQGKELASDLKDRVQQDVGETSGSRTGSS
jgi:gas vesicle protein